MTSYATTDDIQARMTRTLSEAERDVCEALLQDAAVMIDTVAEGADTSAKLVVSCRMVIRAIGDGAGAMGVPVGATQGNMSALGYSQGWTIGSGGSTGELYLGKQEKILLGVGNRIGSYSPVEELVPTEATP